MSATPQLFNVPVLFTELDHKPKNTWIEYGRPEQRTIAKGWIKDTKGADLSQLTPSGKRMSASPYVTAWSYLQTFSVLPKQRVDQCQQ